MKETVVFHVLDSLTQSKLFLYACSRSQKTHRKELSGHYLAEGLGPLPPLCADGSWSNIDSGTHGIIGVDLLDCQISVWDHDI